MNARAAAEALSLPPVTDTYGQPECNTHLIAKLRRLDPALLATLTAKDTP